MLIQIRRALLSVSDKTGIIDLARLLLRHDVEILATGGTAQILKDAGIAIIDIAEITNFPEIMGGRLKTLHPLIHGGLLGNWADSVHCAQAEAHSITPIDLLVVNLYPFEQALAQQADWAEMIEKIDIGGPAMIRAAAKNHAHIGVVIDPQDYEKIGEELGKNSGAISLSMRQYLAVKAFGRTAAYDATIANWLSKILDTPTDPYFTLAGKCLHGLRYGENPHQSAALYEIAGAGPGVAMAEQLQGKALSYNNLADANAAVECLIEFEKDQQAACVIVKHANPCGVALAASPLQAYRAALHCDRTSAFGGIIAFNRPIDAAMAVEITKIFTELIVAPDISEEARQLIKQKKDLRLLILKTMPSAMQKSFIVHMILGGMLVQSRDNEIFDESDLKIVTKRHPSRQEMQDLLFAFKVAKHVKSNAIVYAKNQATIGIGAGQMSRLDSSLIARRKSESRAVEQGPERGAQQSRAVEQGPERGDQKRARIMENSVVASDAFFPFADGLLEAIAAGVSAAIQPGGSMRDAEVIAAADQADLAMVFTGMRHFKH